jgi:hypothetical protein
VWEARFREGIEKELHKAAAAFPQAANAKISCGVGICQITITHPDRGSAASFHSAMLGGKFINTPELLNEDNGCNLHAFGGDSEAPNDVFYIECKEGRTR